MDWTLSRMILFFNILEKISPIFLILFLGIILKRLKIINENFVSVSSNLVFYVALPALIFLSIVTAETKVFNPYLVIISCSSTFIVYGISWVLATLLIHDGSSRGSFIQGTYRGNSAIIGLAIIKNLLGASAVSKSAILLTFLMPLYSILSVICLSLADRKINFSFAWKQILLNPLVIASLFAIPFFIFRIKIPSIILQTLNSLSILAFPLALLGIGAGISAESIKINSVNAIISGLLKLLFYPAISVILVILAGLNKEDAGILFLLASVPTAVASFPMAIAMNANSKLAANIVTFTTLASCLTIPAGWYILNILKLV